MKYIFLILAYISVFPAYSQSIESLFTDENYPAIVRQQEKAGQMTPDELYMLGYACFTEDLDSLAVVYYDRAIAAGLNTGKVHFSKGKSLRYVKRLDEALAELEIALQLSADNQEFMSEKGRIYLAQEQFEKALAVFDQAIALPPVFLDPYFWRAVTLHQMELYDKALEAYYVAAERLPKKDRKYPDIWGSIGRLEVGFREDFPKAIHAFSIACELQPSDISYKSGLMIALNGVKAYKRADSVFFVVKRLFDANKIPEDELLGGRMVEFARAEWNGQSIRIMRSCAEAKEMLDPTYIAYVLDPSKEKVERKFLTEKTMPFGKKGNKHLFCEEGVNGAVAA